MSRIPPESTIRSLLLQYQKTSEVVASDATPPGCATIGTIYIVTSKHLACQNLYKIGFSFDFIKDLQYFNAAQPLSDLEIYPVLSVNNVKCVISLERRLHAEFDHMRCIETLNYGWFTLDSLDTAKKIINAHISRMIKYSACDCVPPTEKQVYGDMRELVQNFNIELWLQPQKLSFADVCQHFGLDIENDNPIRIFAEIIRTNKAVLNGQLLDTIGYTGRTFKYKKSAVLRLLHRNPQIKYTMEACPNADATAAAADFTQNLYKSIGRSTSTATTTTTTATDSDGNTLASSSESMPRRYIVMTAEHFEQMLRHMKTFKIVELQHLFVLVKCLTLRYIEYERMYEILF